MNYLDVTNFLKNLKFDTMKDMWVNINFYVGIRKDPVMSVHELGLFIHTGVPVYINLGKKCSELPFHKADKKTIGGFVYLRAKDLC